MSVSIVMPCHNEETVIEQVVRAYYGEIIPKIGGSEFIVIDDCSTDTTFNILEKLKAEFPKLRILKTPVNSGHGKTVRMGYESAANDYIFQVDSDNQFEARDFWKLYELRGGYDFILGYRKPRRDPRHRLILAGIIRFVNFALFRTRIRDANCPFRLIKRKILTSLLGSVEKDALAPNIAISVLAKQGGIKMTEIAVTHYERKTGIVSIRGWKVIKFALRGFKELIKLKRNEALRVKNESNNKK